MIIVKLMGGLGNQMFQYAFGRKQAIRNKTELLLDLSYLNKTPDSDTLRSYGLSVYNVKCILASHKLISKVINNHSCLMAKIKSKLDRKLFNLSKKHIICRENNYDYFSDELEEKEIVYFDGFWQKEKYFKNIRGILLKDFALRDDICERAKFYLDDIKDMNSM